MEALKRRSTVSCVTTGALGLALISLAACSSGESTPAAGTPAPGGSAALQGAFAFVTNRGVGNQNTISVVGTDAQSNLKTISTVAADEFENNALGDMQVSSGDWVFVNLTAGGKVATIDPKSGATPIHEANLPTGTRPVHIYRDPTDGEVIWSMNDGDATNGNDTGCPVGASVSVLHNSHIGAGGNPPSVVGTTCTLAAGHGVTAFSRPTATDSTIPKYAVVTNEKGGQMAFLDNRDEDAPTYRQMIARLDLCTNAGQQALTPAGPVCNDEGGTALNVPFTANGAKPHGIRWSSLTGKVYSFHEGYKEIVEVDPKLITLGPGHNQGAITRRLSLAGTPYTSYGITPNGRFLFLRGADLTTDAQHIIGKLGVVDLTASGALTIANLPDLVDVVPSTFRFTPDGQRMYMLASNTATGNDAQKAAQKEDLLFVYNPSTLPAAPQSVAQLELPVAAVHDFGVLVQGSGETKAVLVSSGAESVTGSVRLYNANHQKQGEDLVVGVNPGSIMFYYPGIAVANNQTTN
ncbi:MAG: hypothetical protein ACXW4A_07200 [Nitrospira sp.]